jgi:hypothetical protein
VRRMMAQDASCLQQAGGLQMKEVRSNGVEAFQQLLGADSRAQTQGDFPPFHANTSGGTVHPSQISSEFTAASTSPTPGFESMAAEMMLQVSRAPARCAFLFVCCSIVMASAFVGTVRCCSGPFLDCPRLGCVKEVASLPV